MNSAGRKGLRSFIFFKFVFPFFTDDSINSVYIDSLVPLE